MTPDEFCDRHDLDGYWREFVARTVETAVTDGIALMGFVPGATLRVSPDGDITDDTATQSLMEYLRDDPDHTA